MCTSQVRFMPRQKKAVPIATMFRPGRSVAKAQKAWQPMKTEEV
jgi:hypothetical protein